MADNLQTLINRLQTDTGFALMNDIPLFSSALAEIRDRLNKLESK